MACNSGTHTTRPCAFSAIPGRKSRTAGLTIHTYHDRIYWKLCPARIEKPSGHLDKRRPNAVHAARLAPRTSSAVEQAGQSSITSLNKVLGIQLCHPPLAWPVPVPVLCRNCVYAKQLPSCCALFWRNFLPMLLHCIVQIEGFAPDLGSRSSTLCGRP